MPRKLTRPPPSAWRRFSHYDEARGAWYWNNLSFGEHHRHAFPTRRSLGLGARIFPTLQRPDSGQRLIAPSWVIRLL